MLSATFTIRRNLQPVTIMWPWFPIKCPGWCVRRWILHYFPLTLPPAPSSSSSSSSCFFATAKPLLQRSFFTRRLFMTRRGKHFPYIMEQSYMNSSWGSKRVLRWWRKVTPPCPCTCNAVARVSVSPGKEESPENLEGCISSLLSLLVVSLSSFVKSPAILSLSISQTI